ncbi:SGNH/GDSL hydrolase family protein [Halieaceae bacterium IMCC14734]|uniref:SGNH/GDSL hydrolase family protein n=1 Tax=Candidatus Litorirhabdus singularis TaxID=2518993 RepID=A0ABT3TC35_9GAMM|nr:SGNH/GDSL hydrolase family protein [Candidatus Litorirhabdus singularis]MCX2979740.1 SGNH/GDSL hydrolase family protein [Candidatus Litorirhabdus singularis]
MSTLSKYVAISFLCITSTVMLGGCGGNSGISGHSATAAPTASPKENPTLQLPGTLIIVGNSIMAGCMASLHQPYCDYSMTTAHLIAEQGLRVVNLSRSGNTIASANAQRVDGGINFTQGDERGTAIWITLGANDFIWGSSSIEQYRNHYLTLLNRIDRIAKQKIFCATPLMSGFDYDHRTSSEGTTYEDYRQVVRDIAGEGQCTLVETSQWFTSAEIYDEFEMPDTLHLGKDGHIHYAKHLLETIRADYSDS